jgi:hypothetical protein
MAQDESRNLCIRREPRRGGNVIMGVKGPGTAGFMAVARPGFMEEIEMEGNKTTARRSRRGGPVRAAAAEPAKVPVKARAKEPVKARAKAPAMASAKVKFTKPKPAARTDVETSLTESDRMRMVELAAFFRAERRGFAAGFEVEDWLAAEAEIALQIPAPPAAKPARKARKSAR